LTGHLLAQGGNQALSIDGYAELPPDGALFIGSRGGPLSPRIVQLTMARLRGAMGLTDSAQPHAVLTGDTLFIGDVGRLPQPSERRDARRGLTR